MFKKIFILSFICLLYSSSSHNLDNEEEYIDTNLLTGTIFESSNNTNIFWIDIHCHNIDDIAGVQFELPGTFQLLDVVEIRTSDIEFEFHHNKKGLILGFSISAAKINKLSNQWSDFHNKYDFNDDIICRIQVKYNNTEYSYPHQPILCSIKTILASPKGQKLLFSNYINSNVNQIAVGHERRKRNIQISFYE